MFTQLLASRPTRERSAGGMLASITLHGFVVAAAVYATIGTTPGFTKPAVQNLVYQPPADPVPPTPTPQTPIIVPPGAPVVSVPISVPLTLPDLTTVPVRTLVDLPPSTRFVPGGIGTVGEPVTAPPAGLPYSADQVEFPASIADNSPVPRFPSALRGIGIEGVARFRFVVDTAGRVELGSVEAISASHEAFAYAVRSTLPRMRFRPGRVDGRPVRQLVELPFAFRITK
jgi:protein TonB